eukprot:TRINITY_DN7206_c1_g1_i1.p1 TRINITY_DN7206_c1_g1~~TRINITY_DN7206_c1_g1_i1.p1  ORF type:complete len:470 (+),score=76.91 TRINITY_DN7206_c1_g1_i1:68-1477(+)
MSIPSTPLFTNDSFRQGPKPKVGDDLSSIAAGRGIQFFLVGFVDLKGVLRTKMVPAGGIKQIQKSGAGFAPAATWLDFGPQDADLVVKPDPSTLIQVPFQPELAMVMGDAYINDKIVSQAPRQVLKEQIAKAEKKGYVFKSGVEPEFFVLSSDSEPAVSDPKDTAAKPCYCASAMMRRYNLLTDITKTLNLCGFGVYQADHEDANGQFEINWNFQDCLTTADQHVFFKWVVKTLSEKHGFRVTFMPRPFANLAGNGCHIHCSLWSGEKNIFESQTKTSSQSQMNLQKEAFHFLGGVMAKARVFCAITNPTVNSYKRLNGASTISGSTWAPNKISWSGNNRSHMVRVPDPASGDRFELRLADGAVNPYLLPAVVLAVGLRGLETQADPRNCFFASSVNMYEIPTGSPQLKNIEDLPLNLLDATRILEADPDMPDLLGKEFVSAFVKLQKEEWREYAAHLSAWELRTTLDC